MVRNSSLKPQARLAELVALRGTPLWANLSQALLNDSGLAELQDSLEPLGPLEPRQPLESPGTLEAVDPPFQHALLCIYSLTAILSITGNLIVILVLSLGKRSPTDLRSFLINLAVSDVTMAVFSIPFTYTTFLWGRWVFLPGFCPVALAMQHVSVIVSVYTLTVIGVDRYNAILHPFELRITKSRPKLVIAIIWVAAFAVSSSQLFISRADKFTFNGQEYWQCEERWKDEHAGQMYTIFIFIVTFAVPLLCLSVAYCAIARCMWMHNTPGNADRHRDLQQLRAKRKVIKMLVTIVALFSLCWLPLQVFLLCWYFIPDFGKSEYFKSRYGQHVYALSFLACHWLANANSFVNPLVYCFMSDNFKEDLRVLLFPKRGARCRSLERGSIHSASTRTTIVHRDYMADGGGSRRWVGVKSGRGPGARTGVELEDAVESLTLQDLRSPTAAVSVPRRSSPSYI